MPSVATTVCQLNQCGEISLFILPRPAGNVTLSLLVSRHLNRMVGLAWIL
jgi:hypothetical protein